MISPQLWTAIGAVFAIFLSSAGSCYASVYGGLFVLCYYSKLSFKSFCPIIIAGVLAIYGLIVGVLLAFKLNDEESFTPENSPYYFSAGLVVGTACLCSGVGMGLFIKKYMELSLLLTTTTGPSHPTDEVTTASENQPLLLGSSRSRNKTGCIADISDGSSFLALLMCLVFLEAIGLYGLILALFLQKK